MDNRTVGIGLGILMFLTGLLLTFSATRSRFHPKRRNRWGSLRLRWWL